MDQGLAAEQTVKRKQWSAGYGQPRMKLSPSTGVVEPKRKQPTLGCTRRLDDGLKLALGLAEP